MGTGAWLARSTALCAVALVCTVATSARAEESAQAPQLPEADQPDEERAPIGTALLAGGAISVVSVATGAALVAKSTRPIDKTQGVYVMAGGLTLAPFVAHAVLGEWARGGVFAAFPATSATAMCVLVAQKPEVMLNSDVISRRWFIGLYAATFTLSTIATFDVVFGERRKATRMREQRGQAFRVVPLLGYVTGLGIEGDL